MYKKKAKKKLQKKTNKYTYSSYTNYYYNNNHYTIGNLFLPALCCLPLAAGVGRLARRCPAGVCMAGIGVC